MVFLDFSYCLYCSKQGKIDIIPSIFDVNKYKSQIKNQNLFIFQNKYFFFIIIYIVQMLCDIHYKLFFLQYFIFICITFNDLKHLTIKQYIKTSINYNLNELNCIIIQNK